MWITLIFYQLPVVSNLLLMNEGTDTLHCIVMLILIPVIVVIWTFSFIGISGYGVSLSV